MNDSDFKRLLEESVRVHGHLCAGQVIGVRMAVLGLEKIGISDPKGSERKDFIVFVEIDRCATDALQSVTGCSLGKRSLRFVDYGKMAATFLNLKRRTAVRVVAREESRAAAKSYFPDIEDKYAAQIEAYKVMAEDELFELMEVEVALREEDMPGRPLRRVQCAKCGEYVQDMREIEQDGKTLCRPCADDGGGYYRLKNTLSI